MIVIKWKIIDFIKWLIWNLNYKIFMKNFILLESSPDFSDNPRALYDEIIKRNINLKYKIIWFLNSSESVIPNVKEKNVLFYYRDRNKIDKIRFFYLNVISKYIVDSNKYIKKRNKYQFRIHLTHGMSFKITRDYFSKAGNCDYVIGYSRYFTPIISELFGITGNKVINLGAPRNDYLLSSNLKFSFVKKDCKNVLWLPTYRNQKNASKNSEYRTEIRFKYGVPCISNEKELINLNKLLKKSKINLIVKLHPAEDHNKIQKINLSNIVLYDENEVKEKFGTLYHVLHYADAMITDYSSVYYDFLLMNKPICLAIPDYEQYTRNLDLLFDLRKNDMGAEIAYLHEDLLLFLDKVSKGIDFKKKQREKLIRKFHKFRDFNSSARVVDVLEEKMREK